MWENLPQCNQAIERDFNLFVAFLSRDYTVKITAEMLKRHTYSDRKILRAVRRDDPAGWEYFQTRFDPAIQSVLDWPRWRFTEDEQQDVRQNIYLQLHKALPTFREDSSLRWFIIQISHKQCVNEIRRQVRQRTYTTPFAQRNPDGEWNEREAACPHTLDPYHEVLRTERQQAVLAALKQLHETCSTSISLFYIENLPYQAISKKLGITVNTVGSRLSKCLDKLHKELRKHPLFERKPS